MRQVTRVGTRTLLTLAMAMAVAVLLVLARTAQAHHSFAMFDQTQQVTLKGTVHEFQWTNPHAWIHLDVPGANGINDSWQVELNSPNNLKRQGWKSTSVKPGDQVTLVLNPLKDGSKGGLFVSITLPDGSVLGDPTRAHGGPINVPSAH
ncbi:MAG TPA: DUF6152 family protein [Steroidobacteraceae bacterium]|nr:DUF6152 family protein [Steroidobacteraceae bacterium]